MEGQHGAIQNLISLPPGMAAHFATLERRPKPEWFAASDPPGRQLGSGGGTAHLLTEAWQATGQPLPLDEWLRREPKLVIHGGGESRRLPAYATVGKPLMPIPAFRWSLGQRLDQSLLDLQLDGYHRVLGHGRGRFVLMVASGDVLLRFDRDLPAYPDVDVLGLGIWLTPEHAKDFGVFFAPRRRPRELAFFLQKPSPARIRELSAEHLVLADSGMWLLSERAAGVLLRKAGWQGGDYAQGQAAHYELYGQFGLALGTQPSQPDPEVSQLTSAVLPLPKAEFYHFGTSRQMIESVSALQNVVLDETKIGLMGARRHPDQYLQNSRFRFPLRRDENHTLWVENSHIPASWQLASGHVLTGVPDNDWQLRLEPGVCLEFVPCGGDRFCVRFYGLNDAFRGRMGDAATLWLGRPAPNWFYARGLNRETAGIAADADLFDAPLFPVLSRGELDTPFLEWLFATRPAADEALAARWAKAERLSARAIPGRADLTQLYADRTAKRATCLRPMFENSRWSVFLKLDLQSTAALFARSGEELPPEPAGVDELEPMRAVHDEMFRAAVLRHRQQPGWETHEQGAFERLRHMIVREAQLAPVHPRCHVQEDQIVWGRSPVRLDLAGGWTDTPPYCLEHGGKVVNLGVDLNGQPPIQVFAKLCPRPELVMRSIDLGAEQRLTTYEELDTFAQPGSEFAVAKAALALVGFLPRFHAQGGYPSLRAQLEDFGGGLEVSLLSAVPKGSGLGTSSILAATLLATLGELCGLGWDRSLWFSRTLALEQMLTTGGGWQDQAGGIYRGVKLVETNAGLAQMPTLRWLPDHLFEAEHANRDILLYYTGLTRLAKNILHEIVRGMFLNSPAHLSVVDDIGANAEVAFNAIQQSNWEDTVAAIQNSWILNQRLDAGTNPPAVQAILDRVGDYLSACKLLGAGGGGYLLMFAKDAAAGDRIRRTLNENPPNPRARFVNFSLSERGLQITRS